MQATRTWVVLVLVTSLILLQGCAANKSFVKKDLTTLAPLKVVYHETPSIRRSTLGGAIFSATTDVLLAGVLGAAVIGDAVMKSDGKEAQEKIYDFGYMVMKTFVKRAINEIPDWPAMNVINKPVGDDYSEQSTLLKFQVEHLAYGYRGYRGSGFQGTTTVTMKDATGDVLWQRSFTYIPNDFNRNKSVDEFEADNYKLLKEELEFAAEKTAADFIAHFKQ